MAKKIKIKTHSGAKKSLLNTKFRLLLFFLCSGASHR